VLSDLLICRNDSFFNFLFEQIFSRKLQATINGENVSYDQLRDHFLSLRRAYCDSHPLPSSSSSSSCSSSSFSSSSKATRSHTHTRTHSLAPAPASVSPFSPDGSVLKFGPFIANSNNGGREGYLAAHSVLANLINPKWESSPLLSAAQLQSSPSSSSLSSSSEEEAEGDSATSYNHANGASPAASATSSSSSSSDEAEEVNPESTPRKRRMMARSSHLKNQQHHHERRIKDNALVVTDVLEIQWMEGIDGECRRITKFERVIRRPVASPAVTAQKSNKRRC
jgi:hypothetical protein